MAHWSVAVLLSALVGLSRASTVDIDGLVEDGEDRTIFTSGGTYYIALNTTYLLYYTLLAGTLLLAFIALSSLLGGSAEEPTGYGQQYGYSNFKRKQDGPFNSRTRRQAEDEFARQLNILAEAFSKYEVEKSGCQQMVACASSSSRKTGNQLAKTVFTVMKSIENIENKDKLYGDDKYLKDIVEAFQHGSEGNSCSKYQDLCGSDKSTGYY